MGAVRSNIGSGGGKLWQRAADLGCGTGLMGPLLRSHVACLEGADLSAAMVERAREKGCYDRRVQSFTRPACGFALRDQSNNKLIFTSLSGSRWPSSLPT